MSFSIGYDESLQRDIGYGVPALCDHPGCATEIHRGVAYVCGGDFFGGDHGCGMHFCDNHRQYAGDKRDNALLCSRCYHGRGGPYPIKPDLPEWMRWKLTDERWGQWRKENTEEVAKITAILAAVEGKDK